MADIRAMLRNELAARKSAASTSSSTTAAAPQSQLSASKKRKHEPASSEHHTQNSLPILTAEEGRKRQRSGAYPLSATVDQDADIKDGSAMSGVEETEAGPQSPNMNEGIGSVAQTAAPQPTAADPSALDDEWALFEQEVIAPTKETDTTSHTFTSIHTMKQSNPSAVISAPAREEMLEGEKEDAELFLMEEFDTMERLEERLKVMRERKAELERRRKEGVEAKMEGIVVTPKEEGEGEEADDENESEDEDDEDEEEWDEWGFGR
ncbi:hypothetical protein AAP_00945 [Ascosphaera apis ARSEF 7405]|uniref:Uncharacterized protein n=1 Tax=Ascosphaera apis ARSEF 7405 TaxID=392613 RepID=A0A162IQU0_9EURO|nr:hypothetical protein AAP_00945 [Ascosphaera apis ARSEF 7405]